MKSKNKIIGVIGVGKPKKKERELAYELGQKLAQMKLTIVCGGLGGVMEEVSRGAAEKKGIIIGLLPSEKKEDANPYITYPIPTNMGHARNIIIAHTADILIAIGKGYGTLSEMAIGLKLEKKVISLKSWDIDGSIVTQNVNAALKEISKYI